MQRNLQRFVSISPGATTSAGSVGLGHFDVSDPRSVYQLRKLRVVPLAEYTSQLSCMITLPGGIEVGPIDLPMALNVELPVVVVVSCPTPDVVQQTVMCTIADLPDSPNNYSATRLFFPTVANADVVIPPAAIAVTGYGASVLTFKTAGGATICTVGATSNQFVARPRLARTVASSLANQAILFHY